MDDSAAGPGRVRDQGGSGRSDQFPLGSVIDHPFVIHVWSMSSSIDHWSIISSFMIHLSTFIHYLSIMYPSFIHHLSIMYPPSIHHLSIIYPSFIHHVSTIYPSFIHHPCYPVTFRDSPSFTMSSPQISQISRGKRLQPRAWWIAQKPSLGSTNWSTPPLGWGHWEVNPGASGCGKKSWKPMVFTWLCICVSHIFDCEILICLYYFALKPGLNLFQIEPIQSWLEKWQLYLEITYPEVWCGCQWWLPGCRKKDVTCADATGDDNLSCMWVMNSMWSAVIDDTFLQFPLHFRHFFFGSTAAYSIGPQCWPWRTCSWCGLIWDGFHNFRQFILVGVGATLEADCSTRLSSWVSTITKFFDWLREKHVEMPALFNPTDCWYCLQNCLYQQISTISCVWNSFFNLKISVLSNQMRFQIRKNVSQSPPKLPLDQWSGQRCLCATRPLIWKQRGPDGPGWAQASAATGEKIPGYLQETIGKP